MAAIYILYALTFKLRLLKLDCVWAKKKIACENLGAIR